MPLATCPTCPVPFDHADHCHAPLRLHLDGHCECLDACLLPLAAHDLTIGCPDLEDGCCAPPADLDGLLPIAA